MEQKDLDLLKENGFDVEGALHRFLNNKDLYKICLKKFLDDTSYDTLVQAFQDGNCQEAFKAAHTMKGLTSNLGMDELYHILQPMVEKLRVEDMTIEEDLKNLEGIYKKTYDLVDQV